MKINERERCDTGCVVMRRSNSEVYLRQYKILIIWFRDNKNSRQKTKTEKNKRMTQAVLKEWELNDFVVHLS